LQILDETVTICIVGMNLAVLAEYQCIGRPDQCGAVGHQIDQIQHLFLVRDRDVDTDKPGLGQGAQDLGQVFGGDIHRNVMAGQTHRPEPVSMYLR